MNLHQIGVDNKNEFILSERLFHVLKLKNTYMTNIATLLTLLFIYLFIYLIIYLFIYLFIRVHWTWLSIYIIKRTNQKYSKRCHSTHRQVKLSTQVRAWKRYKYWILISFTKFFCVVHLAKIRPTKLATQLLYLVIHRGMILLSDT